MLNKYEKLLVKTESDNLCVEEKQFKSRAKGLIKDKKIGIRKDLPTLTEKTCILAEELGHYYTSCGDILDQTKTENVKQEKRARNWAYEKLVPPDKLIEAYESGVRNRYELALYLDVIEEFLEEAINHYKEKYGLCRIYDDYIIYFEPLGVFRKMIDKQ
ncbi:hypothetical protein LY28_00048 [Ruminiclostridium sufflavum DSM 19573]|uniref:IrrE N-terminal-like domain-containing protein n=1 Tax=Ruminiclostridium sufflavum DSM 19573 TaxID=1121337 RepID=A0A318Y3L9_9FIRM|nr:ImmA/IrrE family metallo-endopeptidase [Ruminiclostridium sufflavum]PYG90168.1 hypothetical protein LY28_00048 [Ruminiclostridium sufflavum DSM 19573]